jgi:hypothetical protein
VRSILDALEPRVADDHIIDPVPLAELFEVRHAIDEPIALEVEGGIADYADSVALAKGGEEIVEQCVPLSRNRLDPSGAIHMVYRR